MGSDGKGGYNYPIKAINVLKSHGKSARESMLIKGYALNCTIAAQQMPRSISKAKIACLDFSLQKVKMKMGVQLLVNDPIELEKMRDRESDITKERINKILATGANVILTTGGIDDLCLKYFVEAGAMAVRRCKKQDLKRIAEATGASFVTSLANVEGEESFEASLLGEAETVAQTRISDDELILIKGTKARTASSIILRGPNDFYCDDGKICTRCFVCCQEGPRKQVSSSGWWMCGSSSVYLPGKLCNLPLQQRAARHCRLCKVSACYS